MVSTRKWSEVLDHLSCQSVISVLLLLKLRMRLVINRQPHALLITLHFPLDVVPIPELDTDDLCPMACHGGCWASMSLIRAVYQIGSQKYRFGPS